VIKNVVPVIRSSPWNLVAMKNFDPCADSATVNGALTSYRRNAICII
jgi:hypothetical protein